MAAITLVSIKTRPPPLLSLAGEEAEAEAHEEDASCAIDDGARVDEVEHDLRLSPMAL